MPQAHVRMTFTAALEVSPEEFKHSLFPSLACVWWGGGGWGGDAAVASRSCRKMFECEHPPSERRQTPERKKERFNHKDLLPPDFKTTMLPSGCSHSTPHVIESITSRTCPEVFGVRRGSSFRRFFFFFFAAPREGGYTEKDRINGVRSWKSYSSDKNKPKIVLCGVESHTDKRHSITSERPELSCQEEDPPAPAHHQNQRRDREKDKPTCAEPERRVMRK